jgi:hypothetical protein
VKTKLILLLVGVLCVGSSALAQPITSNFAAEVDANGDVVGGLGDWIEYPDAPTGAWWNTWFYDHPPDPTRWKEIDLTFCVTPADAVAEVTINWSTLAWPETGPAGLYPGPADEFAIERLIDYGMDIEIDPATGEGIWQGTLPVPYNPEWVSIDIRGESFTITGCLVHDCVPEPATMSLLALGAVALLKRKSR